MSWSRVGRRVDRRSPGEQNTVGAARRATAAHLYPARSCLNEALTSERREHMGRSPETEGRSCQRSGILYCQRKRSPIDHTRLLPWIATGEGWSRCQCASSIGREFNRTPIHQDRVSDPSNRLNAGGGNNQLVCPRCCAIEKRVKDTIQSCGCWHRIPIVECRQDTCRINRLGGKSPSQRLCSCSVIQRPADCWCHKRPIVAKELGSVRCTGSQPSNCEYTAVDLRRRQIRDICSDERPQRDSARRTVRTRKNTIL